MTSETCDILLVESGKYHRLLIQREIGRKFPFAQLTSLDNCKEALLELRRKRFAAVLLDASNGSGAVARNVNGIKRVTPAMPILVLTTKESDAAVKKLLGPGVTAYLKKDSAFHNALPTALHNLLKKKPQRPVKPRSRKTSLASPGQVELMRTTAGTLYHELNNPLMAILGVTELMLTNGRAYDKDTTAKMEIIRESAQRIVKSLGRLQTLQTPSYNHTASGRMIDPDRSRVLKK
jgi:DNA-binding NarL/FixJ family response regulator